MSIDMEKEILAAEMKGSLLLFCQYFYPLLYGREFILPQPVGRESHVITICRALTKAFRLEITTNRLLISVPPGHGKSTMLLMWVAWAMAQYPDSKFLYISYSISLAAKHTETIRRIIQLPHYKYLFDVEIRHDARGKEFFQTTHGGAVAAFGSMGSIVGTDGGLPGLDRFSGAVILDDMLKVDEAHSETIRNSVILNYRETIQQRARGINVPFISIGQRVHEADLSAYLLSGADGYMWEHVKLQSIDEAGNALYPEAFPLEMLRIKEEMDPYVHAAQYQQEPVPAGGSLFKPEWFVLLDEEPEMLLTFITADTAETSKNYNDATVFCFWGIYGMQTMGRKTGELGLHWLDCLETRVEPKDLKDTFLDFYADCTTHATPPLIAAIEKKSTGVTLVSVLQEIRGISIRAIERNRSSGSKTQRFLETQPHVAAKKVSFTTGARHASICIEHMLKITANDSHRHDDIADNLADAIRLTFIEKSLYSVNKKDDNRKEIMQNMAKSFAKKQQAGVIRHGGTRYETY